MTRRGGFTLIEVLVALAIGSAIIVALYATFFSVLKARTDAVGGLERAREVAGFLDTFSREAASAFFKESNARTMFAGERSAGGGFEAASLSMTAFAPTVRGAGVKGDLVGVRYLTAYGEDGKPALYKETWNPYVLESAFRIEVIEDIEGVEFSFYNGTKWAKVWDARLEKRLPTAIKAALLIREGREIRRYSAIARPVMK
ncbi:MAG: prepilin-type N-terminal cleavage/methylation domain-containing protein [Deltaproteobacteria bacterium]|nr:prepilin-type N-terminal cleavage/methylation domain-containing protein [Deltaproteobacteria bacterium]